MRIVVLLVGMTISMSLFSQDYLYKKDGNVIPDKEVNTTPKTISFKIYSDTTNYKYFVSVFLVDSIVYSSGAVTRYNAMNYKTDKRSLVGMDYPKPNTVFFDFYETIFLYNFNIGYEYMFVRPQIGLSLTFTRSYTRNTVYFNDNESRIDEFDLFSSPEYGIKFSCNIYAINTAGFNYGFRLSNYTVFYQKEFYTNYDYVVEPATYNIFGFGLFARYQFVPLIYGLAALEVYFNNKSSFLIYPLPQFAIGINF